MLLPSLIISMLTSLQKPWRHIPSTDGTFLSSFGLKRRTRPAKSPEISSGNERDGSPGKGSQEMTVDARDAYRRRELELADAIKLRDMRGKTSDVNKKRNWWDHDADEEDSQPRTGYRR